MPKTYEFAERIARAHLWLCNSSSACWQVLQTDFRTTLDIVAFNMPVVRASEDHQEALRAMKEKRAPNFKGR